MTLVIILKCLFKNTTQYTKNIYKTYLAFHRKKYGFTYKTYTAIIIALILFCLVLQIKYHYFTLAIIFCCIFTAFILWRLLHPVSVVAKEYKSEKIQDEKKFTFKFYQKYFTVEDDKEISKMKYYNLHKVFETKKFFYLYIDKTYALLIDKSKFQKNNASDFSNFIHKKCWWCFKKVK